MSLSQMNPMRSWLPVRKTAAPERPAPDTASPSDSPGNEPRTPPAAAPSPEATSRPDQPAQPQDYDFAIF